MYWENVMRGANLLRCFCLKKTRILYKFGFSNAQFTELNILNGLNKLNARKVNTVKSSNILCNFFICISKGQESCSIYARLTSSKDT